MDGPGLPHRAGGGDLWATRARIFHSFNPQVFDRLVSLALSLKARGIQRWGIGSLWEVIRWQDALSTTGGDGYQLNNNFRAWYARHIMETVPDLAGFFTTREQGRIPQEVDDGLRDESGER